MKNYFRNWYDESGQGKASGVEIFLFYISLIVLVLLSIQILYIGCPFDWKYLALFLPILIWMFLRSSRKDMKATANWVAGIFGAIGGAIVTLLSIYLKGNP